jgi:hypothetical protein
MENLIKLHKAQPASDRMSWHSGTVNQARLALLQCENAHMSRAPKAVHENRRVFPQQPL